jgi:septal ring factor EnvC (AmiA/AmiB activator)
MGSRTRLLPLHLGLAIAALGLLAALPGHARGSGLSTLRSELGRQSARSSTLSSSIGRLDRLIGSLDGQIGLVEHRESAVAATLARERAQLRRVHLTLTAERVRLALLRHRLADARQQLAAQLRAGYETARPDLVTVILDAHGFQDLLTTLSFLGRAQHSQQRLIALTATAKRQAGAAATRLAELQRTDARITHGTQLEARALAGMNSLLHEKQSALARARSAQALALDSSQAASRRLRTRIGAVQAARRAAAAARAAQRAAAAAAAAAAASPTPAPVAGTPSGGWAIPYPIVLCESGGQDLPPNGAGASGYYQIIPSTWTLFGGTGPAAYLATKAEQDAVATRIWNGGAGASNWVCAGIVGIS